MKWIADHPRFSAVAIAIAALLALIVASSQLSRYDTAAGRTAGAAIAAIQKPFAAGIDYLGGKLNAAFTDEALRAENEALKEGTARLEDELAKNRLDAAELEELQQLKGALGADAPRGEYTLKAASILAFEGSDIFNIFTIDVGTEKGALRDTVVIAQGGLVGRVLEANALSSKVVAIIDENNKIGFQIEGRPTELGICSGDGNGGLAGEMLDDKADIHVGDRIVTSGIGGIYPAGIVIGTVTSAEFAKESPLLHLEIEPAVNFKGIKKVALLL